MIEKHSKDENHTAVLITAWVTMVLASSLAIIIWREIIGPEPDWYPWVHFTGIVVILIFSLVLRPLKVLRAYVLIFLIIFLLGFGGGWRWGLIPLIRSTPAWISFEESAPWALSSILTHLLRFSPALVIMGALFLMGRKRSDLFLMKGTIDAPVEPSRLLGMKHPEPWTRIGTIFAIVFSAGTLTFLLLTTNYTTSVFIEALPLIPVAILIAAINGFNEEFTLRAAPLSELWKVIGKQQALYITTLYFALGHFYGVPNGFLGVLLSGFLGWFLGKSLIETRGFFWAWIIHFVQDVFIFTFYAMSTL